jgi:hypothetical protein
MRTGMAVGSWWRRIFKVGSGLGAIVICATALGVDTALFFGPTPYSGFADSAFTNTNGFAYFYLEDFEDNALNTPGAQAPNGWLVLAPGPLTDSVDADDGVIDGSGTAGRSFFSNQTSTNLTITFHADNLSGRLPSHAGIVCTDIGSVLSGSFGIGDVTLEARDALGTLLGSIVKTNFGNGSVAGNGRGAIAEDCFFGVVYPAGISSISLIAHNSVDWEVDHLQYGRVQPRLRIQVLPSEGIVIAWPANAFGFAVQESENPAPTSGWSAVTNLPATVGTEQQITVPLLPGSRYFRLVAQ